MDYNIPRMSSKLPIIMDLTDIDNYYHQTKNKQFLGLQLIANKQHRPKHLHRKLHDFWT